MTEERITFNPHIKPANYRQLQTRPLYINLVPIIQSWQKSYPALGAENLRDWQWHQQGLEGFDDALRKVSGLRSLVDITLTVKPVIREWNHRITNEAKSTFRNMPEQSLGRRIFLFTR